MDEPPALDDGSSYFDSQKKERRQRDNTFNLEERFYRYGIRPEWLQIHKVINHRYVTFIKISFCIFFQFRLFYKMLYYYFRVGKDGKNKYFIKWRDLPYDQSTWEDGEITEGFEIPDFQKAVNFYWDLR